ncbi:SGNH/GDSL hydrolase family protein [Solitalea canadensis]|uniref:Lysophospholipase L1-like esterase n=1 Tax=Solitalea canadensis (strain ATCC 29591 / DSM 3403 / JCM 21819 / LMG 8368 / NBRC 15130 / NCIMB 12057 / USAM 9D) TaxID=929556 RepID=H8KN25_SOLCM|nr:SGNH/GDSL hydrolase family protein [Solitalea canadensis]AFD09104.1 lysophospholipase L1-like esterase [Solitalea canadensis DSM 3403]
MSNQQLTYLALGDSYTIGEAVEISDRYPVQLVELLKKDGIDVDHPEIIATTGWTTDELMKGIEKAKLSTTFDFVTLLIGVNNQYRKRSTEAYRSNFKRLLRTAKQFAKGNKKRVFVLSIPDWGVTPYGKDNLEKITPEINRFNAVNKEESEAFGVHYIDITQTSYAALNDLSLIASDDLHFSGKLYAQWAEMALPVVKEELK